MDGPTLLEGIGVLAAFGIVFAAAYAAQKIRDAGRRFIEFAETLDEECDE